MQLTASETTALVEILFPDLPGVEKVKVEQIVTTLFEGKDVGRFKGDISVFKQRALDTVNAMPKAISFRRKEEKVAGASLDKLVDNTESEMMALIRRYRADDESRKISLTRFKSDMKFVLKSAYRKAYDLGTSASGIGREFPGMLDHQGVDEKRFVDNVFSQEQKYFNKFLADLARGESISRAEVRVRNYANAIRSVYEASRTVQLPDDTLIYWVLQSKNPCPECRLMHRNSPFTKNTLPTTPKSGSTRCLSFCYCKLRVVKAKPEEVERVARKNRSAEHVLRQLKQSRKS